MKHTRSIKAQPSPDGITYSVHRKDRSKLSLPDAHVGTMHSQVHRLQRTSQHTAVSNTTRYLHATPWVCRLQNDTQTDMLPGYPESAICVQIFDDSLNSAIHTTYRNWLRSSSMHEPRDPPLEVVSCYSSSDCARQIDA